MKNLNKIWGLIIVGVVMLVSCNTYDRSGVSDVGVPSGVTMEGMYDDISSVLSEHPLSDADMAEFERIFGDVSLTDLDIEEVMGNTDYIEYIQTTDYYKEMMKVVEKYLGGVESGLDSSSVISAINQLRDSDYVLMSYIRNMDKSFTRLEDKMLVIMYSAFRNYGYAKHVGTSAVIKDLKGNEMIYDILLDYDVVSICKNQIPLYDLRVEDVEDVKDVDIISMVITQPSFRYIYIEEYEKLVMNQIKNINRGTFPLKVDANDCEKNYRREKNEALNNYNICTAKAFVIAVCGMCIGAATRNVQAFVYSSTIFAVEEAACKKIYDNALALAQLRYEECKNTADKKCYTVSLSNLIGPIGIRKSL